MREFKRKKYKCEHQNCHEEMLLLPVLCIDLSREPLGLQGSSVWALVDRLYEPLTIQAENMSKMTRVAIQASRNLLVLLTEVHSIA